MTTPSELVVNAFAQAEDYAAHAQSMLATFTSRLNDAVQNAPLLNVTFTPIPSPGASSPPTDVPEWVGPVAYTDTLLEAISAAICLRMAGGTGLPAVVEAAIWDRARDRELVTMQAQIDQVTRDSEALGYMMPPGVVTEQIRVAQRAYFDNVAAASRDIAIKQAELEQSNLQKIFDQAVTFSGVLADIRFKDSQVALDIFKGKTEGFKAEIMRFSAEVEQDTKFWEASIKQNEAAAIYTMNGQKMNTEIIRANLSALLEAGKTGAQVYAQLAAAAYGLIHAQATVSASSNMQVSYSYSNDTATQPGAVTVI